ncbi:MAG: thioredoxin domain-containing protein, partial [Rhodospirillales bacterium]|nr:thioredoxin domain-containing protein [Rhodospirillales bacterium]
MTENTLHLETSPYLLQHADNPVHWKAWKPETFAEARKRNLPILLSVGYAACHWCHVMAHESFETPDIAEIMNVSFINIKVDREERPDIDGIYQHALMLLGKQVGWPLTMFLTPDGDPFWGGTYFPPTSRHGLPAFPDLLKAITDFYATKQDQVTDAVNQLKGAMTELTDTSSGTLISMALIDDAATRLAREIDPINGGIGSAPKFPNPSIMELLWRAYKRNGNSTCKEAVLLTLTKMSAGGIYDHLGGGYARYSTDERWLAPHFEKMLYDNAQLLDLLLGAWQETQDPIFAARITETADWILREMVTADGGIASTIDADSEGIEGKFYIWSKTEIDQLLGTDADLFNAAYDVTENGNWENVTILNRNHPAGPFTTDQEHTLTKCRKILF